MIRSKPVLVSIGVAIAAIRVLGHSPALWLYVGLEVLAYCLVLLQLFWPTVVVEKGITVKTMTIAGPNTQELVLSPIDSTTSFTSEGSQDSLQSTIRTIQAVEQKADLSRRPPIPLLRAIPGGFPKPIPVDNTQSRVCALVQPSSIPLVKLAVPLLPLAADPEVECLRQMNAFEAAALQRLSEVTKQVTEAVKAAQQREEPAPVLTHTPSIVDLPKEKVIKEGGDRDSQGGKEASAMEVVPFAPSSEGTRNEDIPTARVLVSTGQFSGFPPAAVPLPVYTTQPFAPAISQPPVVYQQVEMAENSSVPAPFHSASRVTFPSTRLSNAIPLSTGFHTASKPVPNSMDVVPRQEAADVRDTYASRLAAEDRPSLPDPPNSDIRALQEHLTTKQRLRNSIGEETYKEVTRFAYSIVAETPNAMRIRRLRDRLSGTIQRTTAPLFLLAEQLIKLNIHYLRQPNGLVLADSLVRWVCLLSQEWSLFESCFVHELQTQEPGLHPSARTHPDFSALQVPLTHSYGLAILYAFLMRAKTKVTLSEAWTLLASYANAPYDASCVRLPAVIAGLLRVVGYEMSVEYAHQFRKLVNLLINDYLKGVPESDPAFMYVREIGYLTLTGKFRAAIGPGSKV